MTHDTDCEIKPEFRERLNELARKMYSDDRGAQREVTEDLRELGWVRLGSGISRRAFRVPSDLQDGPTDTVTRQVPCVVKLAKPGIGLSDGQDQNRDEIHNFKTIPDDLLFPEEGVPLFVPLSDWDRDDYLWMSLPEATNGDPAIGSTKEVKDKLKRVGWWCDDLHDRNVAEMHGESVIIDYGADDCYETTPSWESADDLGDLLQDWAGARSIVVDVISAGSAVVQFLPPVGLNTDEPVKSTSVIEVRKRTGRRDPIVPSMDLYFGSWDATVDRDPTIEEASESVASRFFGEWSRFSPDIQRFDIESGDDVEVNFLIEFPFDEWPAYDAAAHMYQDLVNFVGEEMPGESDVVTPEPTEPTPEPTPTPAPEDFDVTTGKPSEPISPEPETQTERRISDVAQVSEIERNVTVDDLELGDIVVIKHQGETHTGRVTRFQTMGGKKAALVGTKGTELRAGVFAIGPLADEHDWDTELVGRIPGVKFRDIAGRAGRPSDLIRGDIESAVEEAVPEGETDIIDVFKQPGGKWEVVKNGELEGQFDDFDDALRRAQDVWVPGEGKLTIDTPDGREITFEKEGDVRLSEVEELADIVEEEQGGDTSGDIVEVIQSPTPGGVGVEHGVFVNGDIHEWYGNWTAAVSNAIELRDIDDELVIERKNKERVTFFPGEEVDRDELEVPA